VGAEWVRGLELAVKMVESIAKKEVKICKRPWE